MSQMKTAGDMMIPLDQYPHIPYWFTIRQAIAELEKSMFEVNGRKSLPRVVLVFDKEYRLKGLVRRRDLLRGLEPDFLVSKPLEHRKNLFDLKIDPNLTELSYDKMIESVRRQGERPVGDVMMPILVTVNYEDHLIKVIYEMVEYNTSLVPVIQDGKIVGAVRSVEVMSEVARLLL